MSKIIVAGKEFELIKRGRAQAMQVYRLGQWLNQYGDKLFSGFMELPDELSTIEGISFLGKILGSFEPDALLGLYEIILGCTSKFADKNFDVVDLIESVIIVYQEHPTIRRLVDRFFSTDNSNEELEESSTQSDLPTDGQTSKS